MISRFLVSLIGNANNAHAHAVTRERVVACRYLAHPHELWEGLLARGRYDAHARLACSNHDDDTLLFQL